MGKILHLIPDEKFTNDIINNFNEVYDENHYLILGDKSNKKHKIAEYGNILWISAKELNFYELPSNVSGVVVHGLNFDFSKFLLRISSDIKVAWYAWGYDIYLLPKIQQGIYDNKTLDYLRKNNKLFNLQKWIKNNIFLRKLYFKLVIGDIDYYSTYEKAHKKINYFCTYIVEDFEVFQKFYPNKLEYVETGYFTLNQYLGNTNNSIRNKNGLNILVGNSNSVENNHLDLFYKLKEFNKQINSSSIICPLNYGDNNSYKSEVINVGNSLFGDNFKPLMNFMPREDYIEILKNCSSAIFYHFRQQAMGNIFALLYLGCRVYLSTRNPIYSYFKRIGIIVFDFDKDFKTYLNTPLNLEHVDNNREILKKTFSPEVIRLQTRKLIDLLLYEHS